MNSELAPIVLFVYDRPWHTQLTLESLQDNILSEQSELFIYADGPTEPATENQVQKIKQVRDVINSRKWCKGIHLIESECNKGLASSLISGITEVINKYGKGIILEDDMVTSKYFLKFMNEALNQYEKEEDVVCINGYIYPIKEKLPETFFIKGADCWGWATWKRGWDIFEINGEKLLAQLKAKEQTAEFDYDFSYPYTKMLQDQIEGRNNSWAIRWYASAFIENKLTLYPGRSLVQNIGTDESGYHFKNKTDDYKVKLSDRAITLSNVAIQENLIARKYFEKYFRMIGNQKSFFKKMREKINSYIKKLS